jgi:hypothetical protein
VIGQHRLLLHFITRPAAGNTVRPGVYRAMKNIQRFGAFVAEARIPMADVTKLHSIYSKVDKMIEDLQSVGDTMMSRPGGDDEPHYSGGRKRVNEVEPDGMRRAKEILVAVSKDAAECSALIDGVLSASKSDDGARGRKKYQAPDEILAKLKEESSAAAKRAGFKKGDTVKFRHYSGLTTGRVTRVMVTEDEMRANDVPFPSVMVAGNKDAVAVFNITELNGEKTPWFEKLSAIAKRVSKSLIKAG